MASNTSNSCQSISLLYKDKDMVSVGHHTIVLCDPDFRRVGGANFPNTMYDSIWIEKPWAHKRNSIYLAALRHRPQFYSSMI
ncbi:hypothetical protein C5167_026665 [Papaver somniferum]|nr:hypothetical protein C5167_026665 [Papaver somniferum]